MKNWLFGLVGATLLFAACEPQQDEAPTLPAAPTAAPFSIQSGGDANTFLLVSDAADVFNYLWEYNGQSGNGRELEVNFPLAGEYMIYHTVFGRGGFARDSQLLVVETDAPFDCANSVAYKFLSNCDSKTWRLQPQEGSLFVGPGDGSVWYQISEDEIDGRPCAYNDTWTFTENGQMIYDTQGDVWAEDYMGYNFECITEAQINPGQTEWGSGTHMFLTNEDAAVPQLTINGLGAFIGLPKVTNGAEVNQPVSSTTYEITRMESNPNGDVLELTINFGPGIWRFTLVSE